MEADPQEKRMQKAVLVLLAVAAGALFLTTAKMAVSSAWRSFVDSRQEQRQEARVVDLRIEGMTCDGCSRRITTALEELPGVAGVTVSHAAGTAVVRVDPSGPSEEQLIRTIEQVGYRATLASGW